MIVIKKNGKKEEFRAQKIFDACNKSAMRGIYRPLNKNEEDALLSIVLSKINFL